MNQRQWKKACKKAAIALERLHPGMYQFVPSDGGDAVYGPPGYRPTGRGARGRFGRTMRLYPNAPKGTPLVVTKDYWGEVDVHTALDVLNQHLIWDDFEPDDFEYEQPFDCALDETCRALWYVLSTGATINAESP